MNFLAWLLAVSSVITMSYQAVVFQRATVCRQKAWLKGLEITTRSLLSATSDREQVLDLKCNIQLIRNEKIVYWQHLSRLRGHHFRLSLQGKL